MIFNFVSEVTPIRPRCIEMLIRWKVASGILYGLSIKLVQIARDITTFRPAGPKCGEWLRFYYEFKIIKIQPSVFS